MLRQLLLTLRSGVFYLGYVMITVVLSTSFILLFPLLKSRADIALRLLVPIHTQMAKTELWYKLYH